MKLFLDANVIFSASNSSSNLHEFLMLFKKKHVLASSYYVLEEAQRNIMLKCPEWNDGLNLIIQELLLVEDSTPGISITLAEKDRPVLGAAIAAKCTHLLTGDKKDFGHLFGKDISGVLIVNYPMLREILQAQK